MKRIAFVLGMALALPLAASEPITAATPPRSELTLNQAFELAWQRQPAAQALPSRQAQSRAESELAAAWTPSAPKVTLGTLTDRYNDRAGWREWEAELAVPLWLPGQRDAQQALAQSQQALVGLQAGAQRLEIAGQLRLRDTSDMLAKHFFLKRLACAAVGPDARDLLHEGVAR